MFEKPVTVTRLGPEALAVVWCVLRPPYGAMGSPSDDSSVSQMCGV